MEFASLRQRGTSLAIVTGAALVAVSILSPSVATAAGSRGSVLVRRSAQAIASVRVAEAKKSATKSTATPSTTAATDVVKKAVTNPAAKGSVIIRKPTSAGPPAQRIQPRQPLAIDGPNLVPQAAGSADVSGRPQSRQQRRSRRSRRGR